MLNVNEKMILSQLQLHLLFGSIEPYLTVMINRWPGTTQ